MNLRNGPGTTDTSIITTITSGQSVTIIEVGKYNGLDGYNWSRVKLSNGTQGYVVSDYLTEVTSTNYIIAYVNCNSDGKVNVRSGAGTKYSVVTSLAKDAKVTVLQKAAGNDNGYVWDKIVTSDGLEGYIANSYLRYENSQPNTNTQPNGSNPNENCDVDGDNIVDSADLYYVIKFLKEIPEEYNPSYDVDKDGQIDSTDLYIIIVYLKQH